MKRVQTKKKRGRVLRKLLGLVVLAVFGYGTWYAYCHYYPLYKNRGNTGAGIVPKEYRFDDINDVHLKAARKDGVKPVDRREEIDMKQLEKIETCRSFKIERLTHSAPYLTATSKELLYEIGDRFQKTLAEQGLERHRVIVTSVLRTTNDAKRLQGVNVNASANSAHLYATTFDISYVRYDRLSLIGSCASNKQLAAILGEVIAQLRKEGRCYAKYERRQRCFHITSRK